MTWPTTGFCAYQSCVLKSDPLVVLVGPANDVQVLPKLSVGVKVTPACEAAHNTIKSPPVLSKGAVVWDV